MSLLGALEEYAQGDTYPLHMPGHKRNGAWLPMGNPYTIDITEIDGFDDLHEPEGILREGMERAAGLYGADESWYLVGGSTTGILAGITACTVPGDTVLVARNCHRSVYHALILNRLEPVYLYPQTDPSWEIAGSVTPEAVEEALESTSPSLVILTSPTYEGVLSDIRSIANLCHRRGIALMVDEAHGAHLGFGAGFPAGALDCGADLVVQSLHKTLPAFTQTGLLHRRGSRVSGRRVKHALDLFQTSSPSYILMAGIDRCLTLLEPENRGWMEDWQEMLQSFYQAGRSLHTLRLLTDSPVFFDRDPSKLVLSTGESGHTGPELMEKLRRDFHFEVEMASAHSILAMTGAGDRREALERFAQNLREIDACWGESVRGQERPNLPSPLPPVSPRLPLWQADREEGIAVPLDASARGAVSLEFLFVYPPGIPLLAPGEEITEAILETVESLRRADLRLRGLSDAAGKTIRVRTSNTVTFCESAREPLDEKK